MKRFAISLVFLLLLATTSVASADESIRVGKAIQNHFSIALLDVGIASGVFKEAGLSVEPVTFTGAAKLQQALTANSIDFGVSTGQDMGFIAKGLPAMTVAAVSNAPFDTRLVVNYNSTFKSVTDLRGKSIAVSNLRGYPAWLIKELSKHEGWGPDGMNLVETGSQNASIALLKINKVDGWGADLGTSFEMEDAHEGRGLLNFGDFVPPFMNLALYATDIMIKVHPDTVRRFVKAWFDNVAWARAHRQKTVDILAPAPQFAAQHCRAGLRHADADGDARRRVRSQGHGDDETSHCGARNSGQRTRHQQALYGRVSAEELMGLSPDRSARRFRRLATPPCSRGRFAAGGLDALLRGQFDEARERGVSIALSPNQVEMERDIQFGYRL